MRNSFKNHAMHSTTIFNFKALLTCIFFTFILCFTNAQSIDTTQSHNLPEVTVDGVPFRNTVKKLDPISGTYIYSGKKSEVISLTQHDAIITQKIARQLFAKVPGIFVYDMEGGNQMNIASRGLDPHRGWEFNMRKDGIIINSDMYGYPASHYSIPLESIDRIELVRGTGALQYGAQFGGMINYVSKKGSETKPLSFESNNTIGSYNMLSTYNAIGGTYKKISYYVYHSVRKRDGYRKNEETDYDAQGINLTYLPSSNLSIRLDWARSNYLYRIPGPLTDAMFEADPSQATRSRNYYNPTINVPSIKVNWQLAANTKIEFISSAVVGARKSVLFDKIATIKDTINTSTGQFNARQVDIDSFNSYTQELRILHQYNLKGKKHSFAAGIQLMNNDLHRAQLGKGTTGGDYTLTLTDPIWGRDIRFKTNNIALFVEHNTMLSERLSVNIGARVESGQSDMSGKIVYYPENAIPLSIKHKFPLLGASFIYKMKRNSELYGGIAQTYRPMLFKDIIPTSTFENIDPNIKDAQGFNAELGYKGNYKNIQWDVTAFALQYLNRYGTLALLNDKGEFYTYRTNIGNSLTKGLEIFIQYQKALSHNINLTLFTSTSLMDGRYTKGELKSGNKNIDIKDNKIESVPDIITRNGITLQFKKLSLSTLYSFTSSTFADAFNTVIPSASGAVGIVPSYGITDLNVSFKLSATLEFKLSVSNVGDIKYFTKRPLFYPGPGVWSSDGRNGAFSLIFRI